MDSLEVKHTQQRFAEIHELSATGKGSLTIRQVINKVKKIKEEINLIECINNLGNV